MRSFILFPNIGGVHLYTGDAEATVFKLHRDHTHMVWKDFGSWNNFGEEKTVLTPPYPPRL